MKLFNNITLAIAALFLVVANSAAQSGTLLRSLQWQAPAKANIAEGWPADYLVFNGSVNAPEYGKVPVYTETIKLTGGNNDFNITISNVVTEPLSPAEKAVLTPLPQLPAKVVAEKSVGYANGVPRGAFRFPGVLFNATQNRYEKVISFEYTVTPFTASKPKSTTIFATNSVLSSGRWYKFAIVNDGVYKIDRAFLTSLGMNGTVNPANIRIYGNGGGALPAVNSTPRIDDLEEIAIEVNGGNDGSFDASDYLLFYGKGQLRWNYNSTAGIFNHVVNQYSDTTYYFITTDLGPGKRISGQASANDATPTYTANTFNDYAVHNKDEVNLIHSGSRWFGEKFDIINDYTFNFNFPNLSTTDVVKVRTAVAANLNVNGNAIFSVKSGSNNLGTVSVADVFGNPYLAANVGTSTFDLTTSSTSIPVTVTKLTNGCEGWLDFIELNVKRNLSLVGNQTAFRAIQGVGTGQITKYNIGNAQNARVWDVTDHQNVALQQISLNGSQATFTLPSDILREFIVHSGSSFAAPIPVGSVNNQNLHATAPVDLIIVSAPQFLAYANQVADIHRTYDNMDVIVTTPQSIYNEFSSGAADIVAIRSFARMLYKRANTADEQPRYLLLFGDGSYDNKYRTPDNTNFVPTYQSDESLAIVGSYTADDYMGLLDDNEGGYGNNEPIDIGIGRIPCQNAGEAQVVVTKINDYINVAGQRDWRNMISFFADDQDYNAHQKQALELCDSTIDKKYRAFNLERVIFDAYVQESNAGGQRYPEVKDILNKRVNRGGLIINYTGHGGEAGWAAEKVLEISDIESWTNKYELPAFVTATCEFSKYDDPARKTAGEMVLVNDNGGICLFTTTRLVYSSPNFILNRRFYENFITGIKLGEQPRIGDLYKQTKVDQASDGNARNFTLLGDPALRLNYPIHDVVTTEINGNPVTETSIDTIKALQLVTVKGYVKSRTGTGVLSNYNGTIYPTIYDKPITIETLGQDADSPQMTFKTQRNIIYKGKASVVNGYWSFTFPVPKDISYQYGYGKISYYVENGERDQDGHGVKELVIGGSDTANFCDNIGPAISLYMNDTKFANGGTTDENPTLLAMLADTNGINTVGTGIGHDLVAILDNNTNEPYVLNDYYEANLNSYSRGTVRYPFTNLKDGPHTLRVKAWDVCNNSNETTLDFVVARTAGLALEHVLNYPNPFTTNTCFMFEHNRPNQALNVQVQVFTVSGKIVKTINTTLSSNGYRADCINWNGLDDFGDKIGRGVYIYRLKITDETGNKADKYEKLVILN